MSVPNRSDEPAIERRTREAHSGLTLPERVIYRRERRKRSEHLFGILREVGLVAMTGLAFGLLFAVGGELLAEHNDGLLKIAGYLVKDLGIGLVVSAFAVYGYELIRDISGMVDEAQDLRASIGSLATIRCKMEEALKAISDFGNPLKALERNLASLFPEDELRKPLLNLVDRALALRGAVDRAEGNGHLKLLGWFINTYATANANQLFQLHQGIREKTPSSQFKYIEPDTRKVAQQILIAQMQDLSEHDHYRSFTNVLAYAEGQFNKFTQTVTEASRKHVLTRRIFNVCNFELNKELRSEKQFQLAKTIVQEHVRLATGNKYYEVRFFGRSLIDRCLIPRNIDFRDAPHLQDLTRSYFGLFHHRDTMVLLVAKGDKFEDMTLSYCDPDPVNNPNVIMFDQLWDLCEPRRHPFEGDAFDENWLDAHCDALKSAGMRSVPGS
jgi:hypothetical protein